MKKLIIVVISLIVIFTLNNNDEVVIIPKSAIRFRVIAISNNSESQQTKIAVRDKIQKELYQDLIKTNNINEARNVINSNLPKYENTVKEALNNIDSTESYEINYGLNYFPEKIYKGVKYNEGNYESLVVTLGNGMGNNWWCVLFPPLCLLEAEETEEKTDVEYKFFIKELIDKYF